MRTNVRLVLLGRKFGGSADAIGQMARLALAEGFVNDLFTEKILERELEFPTGLPMPVPLAIPHVSDGCSVPFVSIAVPESPVAFKHMDCSGDEIEARIIFLFGMPDAGGQLTVLKKFARAFADGEAVGRLLASEASGALLMELDDILDGLLDVENPTKESV
ncbi:MAG: PTS sugar transporter subunit IIA [Synergistaceae bacterium]|jgi:PTS system galactitol-specific IIA component|nr:PTS sugar transporter subunit IIA [Synergistaceae bacterium]